MAALTVTVTTQEPQGPSVAVAIAAAGLAAGSATSLVLLRLTATGRRTRAARWPVIRRGGEVGIALAIIGALQAIGGLNPLTALFVVLTFAVAEYVLSAGASAGRWGR